LGNRDYAERVSQLRRMDALLQESGAEASFIALWAQRVFVEDWKLSKAALRAMTDRRKATVQSRTLASTSYRFANDMIVRSASRLSAAAAVEADTAGSRTSGKLWIA